MRIEEGTENSRAGVGNLSFVKATLAPSTFFKHFAQQTTEGRRFPTPGPECLGWGSATRFFLFLLSSVFRYVLHPL